MWLLSWVSFFADVSSEMIYPLLPLFLIGVLGASKMQLGLIEGAAVLIVAVMTAFAGFRSDRSGKRVRWIRIGYGLPMVGKATIALATAWGLVLGGRLLDRFGKGLRSAPRDAMIAGAVEADQRGRAFGVHRALDTAGALIGVLLSALLLWWLTGSPEKSDHPEAVTAAAQTPAWVYRLIFGVGAGLGLASFLLTFLVRETDAAAPAAEPLAPATAGAAPETTIPAQAAA
ncbi:MAG: MFS transporter, partial [Phycisphaerales bacterium]|nr:MFS transporter [Phycisphaerales bacterium]